MHPFMVSPNIFTPDREKRYICDRIYYYRPLLKSIIIAAISRNNVIGDKGKMPWHSKEEFKHFKESTLGFPVIMGRKTFESLGKPLTGRLNLIITSNPGLFSRFEDIKCFSNLKEALLFCESSNFAKAFIVGGAQIYKEAIKTADELMISRMNFEVPGDKYFPEIVPDEWEETEHKKFNEFEILIYKRKNR
jgi:dihydrofolate reductase